MQETVKRFNLVKEREQRHMASEHEIRISGQTRDLFLKTRQGCQNHKNIELINTQ